MFRSLFVLTVAVASLLMASGGESGVVEAHSATSKAVKVGDTTCDTIINSTDSLAIARYVAGLTPITQSEPCPEVGDPQQWWYFAASCSPGYHCDWPQTNLYGNLDSCGGASSSVTMADALKIDRFVAGYNDPACADDDIWTSFDVGEYPESIPYGHDMYTVWCPPNPC